LVCFDSRKCRKFVGYDQTEKKITRIRKVDSKKDGILYQIVLDNTPFYPEGLM
jgi:alanyl-tRNA synthetase